MTTEVADKKPKKKGAYITRIFIVFCLIALWLQYYRLDLSQLHDVLADSSLQTKLAISQPGNHTIPRRLLFTYKYDLLQEKKPENLYANTMKIVETYAQSWNMPADDVEVLVLTDDQCLDLLAKTEPRLIKPFETETKGAYKADICRIAALYVYGGYYFDVDIQPVAPLKPDPEVDFICAANPDGQFFQAVLAVAPSHPIMKANLQSMLDDWYMLKSSSITPDEFNVTTFHSDAYAKDLDKHLGKYFNMKKHVMVGPATLWMAYEKVKDQITPWILHEIKASRVVHPEFMRPGTGWGCNHVVVGRTGHTRRKQRFKLHANWPPWNEDKHWKLYFYSRVRGTNGCPFLPSEDKN